MTYLLEECVCGDNFAIFVLRTVKKQMRRIVVSA